MQAEQGQAPPPVKYDFFTPAFHSNPSATFHRMRAEDPVFWHPLLNLWVLTRYDDVTMICRDRRFSADRLEQFLQGQVSDATKPKLEEVARFLGHWMLFHDPPRHTLLRGLLAKAFTPQVVERMVPSVKALVDEMIDSVVDGGSMDVVTDLAWPLPAMVISSMLGVPRHQIEAFKASTNDIFALVGAGVINDPLVHAAHRGVVGMQQLFHELIEERRRAPQDDLLSRLIAVEEQGTILTEEELVSTCGQILAAGHESTAYLIGNAILALLQNPDQFRLLRDDSSLIAGALEEFLRCDPPFFFLSRKALEDVEMGGQVIKKGQFAVGMVYAANRDPAHFPDPDRLDIRRTGTKQISFGHGIHFCIGGALARMETAVVLEKVIERLPGLALDTQSLEWMPSFVQHGLTSLPVTFEARDPSAALEGSLGWNGPLSARGPVSMRGSLPPSMPGSIPPPPISIRIH